jgi:hypothetical protein
LSPGLLEVALLFIELSLLVIKLALPVIEAVLLPSNIRVAAQDHTAALSLASAGGGGLVALGILITVGAKGVVEVPDHPTDATARLLSDGRDSKEGGSQSYGDDAHGRSPSCVQTVMEAKGAAHSVRHLWLALTKRTNSSSDMGDFRNS